MDSIIVFYYYYYCYHYSRSVCSANWKCKQSNSTKQSFFKEFLLNWNEKCIQAAFGSRKKLWNALKINNKYNRIYRKRERKKERVDRKKIVWNWSKPNGVWRCCGVCRECGIVELWLNPKSVLLDVLQIWTFVHFILFSFVGSWLWLLLLFLLAVCSFFQSFDNCFYVFFYNKYTQL